MLPGSKLNSIVAKISKAKSKSEKDYDKLN